eukprot:6574849-Alexandrium_andersonii.AAC.1
MATLPSEPWGSISEPQFVELHCVMLPSCGWRRLRADRECEGSGSDCPWRASGLGSASSRIPCR